MYHIFFPAYLYVDPICWSYIFWYLTYIYHLLSYISSGIRIFILQFTYIFALSTALVSLLIPKACDFPTITTPDAAEHVPLEKGRLKRVPETRVQEIRPYPIGSMGLVYVLVPTFSWCLWQIYINIPYTYMDPITHGYRISDSWCHERDFFWQSDVGTLSMHTSACCSILYTCSTAKSRDCCFLNAFFRKEYF